MTVMTRMLSQMLIRRGPRASQLYVQRQPVRNFRKRSRQNEAKDEKEALRSEPYYEEQSIRQANEAQNPNILLKYITYTAVAVPVFFTGCAIWNYENVRKLYAVGGLKKHVENNPEKGVGFLTENTKWKMMMLPYKELPSSKKLLINVIAANVAIFMLWKVRPLLPVMSRYFMCMPTRAHSVLASTLSAFSHSSGFHIFANMYVLWSFSTPVLTVIGKEEYLAVYLAGGTIAGLTSSMFRVLSKQMVPSLGASGAILSLVAIVCLKYPDSRLSIAFVDKIIPHSFSAKSAIFGLVVLDCIGVARGWRVLDHAGHLGGVLFGMFYVQYGQYFIWGKYKEALLKKWHSLRK